MKLAKSLYCLDLLYTNCGTKKFWFLVLIDEGITFSFSRSYQYSMHKCLILFDGEQCSGKCTFTLSVRIKTFVHGGTREGVKRPFWLRKLKLCGKWGVYPKVDIRFVCQILKLLKKNFSALILCQVRSSFYLYTF